jgi:hypothetical protein
VSELLLLYVPLNPPDTQGMDRKQVWEVVETFGQLSLLGDPGTDGTVLLSEIESATGCE